MRKVVVLVISFIFLVSSNMQASPFAPSFNPYSFGPHGRSVADLRDFAKPKQMANILAGRPVVATKQDGTRVYYSSDGKLCLSIKRNGEMSFSLGGHSLNLDKNGNLKNETKTLKGNFQEVRDEFGDIMGYNQLDGHGKIIASYDKDKNKTTVYDYGKFGHTLQYSINVMNGQKTVYDRYERAMAVYDIDGYILKSYQYEDVSYESSEDRKNLLIKKNKNKGTRTLLSMKDYSYILDGIDEIEGLMNIRDACITTYYDKEGLTEYIVGVDGLTSTMYHYEQDSSGNKVLQYVLDTKTKERTYYENNKQMYVLNDAGAKIREFYWDGNKYLFSAEFGLDKDGDLVWTSTTDDDGVTAKHNIVYNEDKQIKVRSEKGKIVEKYFYKENSEGENILDYIENVEDNTKTYFDEDGCAIKTVDSKGNIIIDYSWNDKKLVYSFDRTTGKTTWYDGDNKIAYESLDAVIVSKNIYDGGQLIGKLNFVQGKDENGNKTISYELAVYVNERQEFTLSFKNEPTIDQARYFKNKFINTGIMTTKDIYNDGNKLGEWEYIKRTEENGMQEIVYNLRIYMDNGESFVVKYDKGDPKDKTEEEVLEIINNCLLEHQAGGN